jgi:head-tail adaptor
MHLIALRYRPGVVPAMRFRKAARVFHILSVINVDERDRWLKCFCEEREL